MCAPPPCYRSASRIQPCLALWSCSVSGACLPPRGHHAGGAWGHRRGSVWPNQCLPSSRTHLIERAFWAQPFLRSASLATAMPPPLPPSHRHTLSHVVPLLLAERIEVVNEVSADLYLQRVLDTGDKITARVNLMNVRAGLCMHRHWWGGVRGSMLEVTSPPTGPLPPLSTCKSDTPAPCTLPTSPHTRRSERTPRASPKHTYTGKLTLLLCPCRHIRGRQSRSGSVLSSV